MFCCWKCLLCNLCSIAVVAYIVIALVRSKDGNTTSTPRKIEGPTTVTLEALR